MKEKKEEGFEHDLRRFKVVVTLLKHFVDNEVPYEQAKKVKGFLNDFDSMLADEFQQPTLTKEQKKRVKAIVAELPKQQRSMIRKKADYAMKKVVQREHAIARKERLHKYPGRFAKDIKKIRLSKKDKENFERVLKDKIEYAEVLNSIDKLHKADNEARKKSKIPAKPSRENLKLAKRNKEIYLKALDKYNKLLENVENLIVITADKAKSNPKTYAGAMKAALKLYADLANGGERFFGEPHKNKIDKFIGNSYQAFHDASVELEKHRKLWFRLPKLMRGFLGVIATLTVIPALAVAGLSKPGYKVTFFKTPETKSQQMLNELNGLMVEIGAEVTEALKPLAPR